MKQKQLEAKADYIAQHWMWSCNAPDSDETAREIKRLRKMIVSVFNGDCCLPWKIVNNSLGQLGERDEIHRRETPSA